MELDQVWHGKFKASSDFSVFNKIENTTKSNNVTSNKNIFE